MGCWTKELIKFRSRIFTYHGYALSVGIKEVVQKHLIVRGQKMKVSKSQEGKTRFGGSPKLNVMEMKTPKSLKTNIKSIT